MQIEEDYTCAIFGHRKIEWNKNIENRTKKLFLYLIRKKCVKNFLFGSNSEFYHYCFNLLKEIRREFDYIKLVGFPCCFQNMFKVGESGAVERNLKLFADREIEFMEFDEIYTDNERFIGKNAYILRNEKMAKLSKYAVFYFDNLENGGTKFILNFAKKCGCFIFNVRKKPL